MGLIIEWVLDIECCIISALHLHSGLHGILPTMTGRPLLNSWIAMDISVPYLTLAVQTHTGTRFYSYIHTQSIFFNLLSSPSQSSPSQTSRTHLIIRLHNLITPSSIPKLTPFTLLPPIRFLKSSSM
jgi:hypothetical protein